MPDFDRPIRTDRHDDAAMIAGEIAKKKAIPDHIMASPARRTMQTAKLFCTEWEIKYKSVETAESLYEGSAENILTVINGIEDKFDMVAIICHNPSVTYFINQYSDGRIDNVPTTGAAFISFDVKHWQEISGGGKLKWFLYPKSLKGK